MAKKRSIFASRPVPVQSRQSRQAAAEEEERKQRPWSPGDSEEKRAVVVSALGGRTKMPGGANAKTTRSGHVARTTLRQAREALRRSARCAPRPEDFSRIIFRALCCRSFVLGIYCIAFCLRRVFRLAFPCAALFVSSERAHVPRDASDLRLEGYTHHAKFFFLSTRCAREQRRKAHLGFVVVTNS